MIKLFLLCTLVASLLSLVVISLIVSPTPLVTPPPPMTPEDISQLKTNLKKSNPLQFQRLKHQSLTFDEKHLNQASNFAISRISPQSAANIQLNNDHAYATGTLKIPSIPTTQYINISAKITPTQKLVSISNVTIGKISIPNKLLNILTPFLMQYAGTYHQDYIDLLDAIKKINISNTKLTIKYHWDTALSKKLKIAGRNFLLPPEQQQRLRIYYEALGELSSKNYWRAIELHEIIQPIFSLAKKRTLNGGNPIKENEAAILALGIMASGIRANHLLQDKNKAPLKNAYFFQLTLQDRRDLMQHFLISAALTVSTNITLSTNIGLAKEMDDSKTLSGFSFADLLADRAGVGLANIATNNISSAKTAQNRLSLETLKENDFMPSHNNLPESISELEFKNKYIDIRHSKYLYIEQELHRRIASTPLHRTH